MRKCCKCGKEHLAEGFVIGDGEKYYCSEDCLHQDYTEQEYIDMYEGDYAYWTQWTENEHWIFLEKLRRSGVTNMFGAAPYLIDEFGVSKKEAAKILLEWMKNYDAVDYKD